MADDPIVITGGSLNIHKGKFDPNGEVMPDGPPIFVHPKNGKITKVVIDGNTHLAHGRSKIVIHYDVPDRP